MAHFIQRRSRWGLFFITPWLIGLVVFTLGPIIASLVLSFTHYNTVTISSAGLDNYHHALFEDKTFWKSIQVTALYTALAVPLGLTGSLLLAVLLNQNVRGKGLFRALYYIPTLVPAAAASYLWRYILNADHGLINTSLARLDVIGPDWFNVNWALPSLVVMGLWGIGGGRMIIFLAGLQGVSPALYEAAAIDGATPFQRFRHITLPMITPLIFFNLVLGVIGAFQTFTQAFLVTGGGPDDATLFYSLYLYRKSFAEIHFGYACALAWILFVILAVITAIKFSTAKLWVFYEEASS